MSEHAAKPQFDRSPTPPAFDVLRGAARELTGYWWVWLVSGIAWLVVSLVLLQFDDASVTTVGILVGLMFLLAGAQNLALSAAAESLRWLSALFGACS